MAFRILSRLVALVLLAAAALKLFGLSVSPVAQTGLLLHPAVTVAVVQWEVLLAAILALGVRPALSRYLALATFLAFAAASGYAAFVGSSSCGCFGTVRLNPLYVCLFDLGVVAAFAVFRPDRASEPERPGWSFVRPVVGGIALALFVLGAMSLTYRDPATVLSKLRGETVVVSPMVLDLGRQPGGTEVRASVRIANHIDGPVRLVGGSSDCSCVVTENLPLTVPPGESVDLPVSVKLPKAVGAFHRQVYLWTTAGQRTVVFEITGVIAE